MEGGRDGGLGLGEIGPSGDGGKIDQGLCLTPSVYNDALSTATAARTTATGVVSAVITARFPEIFERKFLVRKNFRTRPQYFIKCPRRGLSIDGRWSCRAVAGL